jgi:hypothetical protein
LLEKERFKELRPETDWGQKATAAIGHRDIAEKASRLFKKASRHFKKASIPLKMSLKSLAILEKASISLKKS